MTGLALNMKLSWFDISVFHFGQRVISQTLIHYFLIQFLEHLRSFCNSRNNMERKTVSI